MSNTVRGMPARLLVLLLLALLLWYLLHVLLPGRLGLAPEPDLDLQV